MGELSKKEKKEIEEKVFSVIQQQLDVGLEEIAPDKSFKDDLGADSLDSIELVMALEKAFDVEIPDEDAEKIKTVKQAMDAIEEKIKEGPKKPLRR